MKNLLLSLGAFLCFGSAIAQSNFLEKQLENIDQSSVTSGIIYERVMKLGNFYNFNQTKEFNTANFDYFLQLLSEMNRASNSKKYIKPVDDS